MGSVVATSGVGARVGEAGKEERPGGLGKKGRGGGQGGWRSGFLEILVGGGLQAACLRPSPSPSYRGRFRLSLELRRPTALDAPRHQGPGQKNSHSHAPSIQRPYACLHTHTSHRRRTRSLAHDAGHIEGADGGRAGEGRLYLYALGVGRGYHAACLVSAPPLAQI